MIGVRLTKMEVRGADDIERAFERLPTGSEQGLIVFPHFVTVSNRKSIIGLAGKAPHSSGLRCSILCHRRWLNILWRGLPGFISPRI